MLHSIFGFSLSPDPINTQPYASQYTQALSDIQNIELNTNLLDTEEARGLQQLAQEGYGQDWINRQFQLGSRQLAQNRIESENKLNALTGASGVANNAFLTRARDRSNASYAQNAADIMAGILAANEGVKQQSGQAYQSLADKQMFLEDFVDRMNKDILAYKKGLAASDQAQKDFTKFSQQAQDVQSKVGLAGTFLKGLGLIAKVALA